MRWTRFHSAATGPAAAALLAPAAWSQQLGGGRAVDVPIVQILAGLLLCTLAAFGFALFLKRRSGANRPVFRNLLVRATSRGGRDTISVLESRRLSPHADACRFTSGDREYLVVVTASSCTVLSNEPISPAPDASVAETSA